MKNLIASDKPLSFNEMLEAEDNVLHNSNMLNLVSAARTIKEGIEHHKAEAKRLQALLKEIETFSAVKENLQNTTEVHRLFNEVKEKPQKSTRW